MDPKPLKRLGGLIAIAATALVLVGCQKANDGAAGVNGVNGVNGTNGLAPATQVANLTAEQWGALSLTGTVTRVNLSGTYPVVTFTVMDNKGNPIAGLSANTTKSSSALLTSYANFAFSIAKLVPGQSGTSQWVSYIINSTPTKTAASIPAHPSTDNTGTLTEDGFGNYTYTFYRSIGTAATWLATQTVASPSLLADLGDVTYQPTLTHRVGVQVSGSMRGTGTNTPDTTGGAPAVNVLHAANIIYDFVPATGAVVYNPTASTPVIPASTATVSERLIVNVAACNSCHTVLSLHGGSRVDPNFCVFCHNEQQKYGSADSDTGLANVALTGTNTVKLNGLSVGNMPAFIHKIHMGANLGLTGYNFGGSVAFNNIWYPQDIRNCTTCHTASTATPQGDNWKNVPSMAACGACHDTVNFTLVGTTGNNPTGTNLYGGSIISHSGGAQADDTQCKTCHTPSDIMVSHTPLMSPAANGTNVTTSHATYVSNSWQATSASNLPAGASSVAYNITSVTVNANANPMITFQVLINGTPAVLNAAPATAAAAITAEMIPNYANGPYVAIGLGLPQDGTAAPLDPNFSREYYWPLKSLWNGTAYTTGLFTAAPANGQLVSTKGPVASSTTGTYTITLDGIQVPTGVSLFGMGIGWGAFTQTNLTAAGSPDLGLQSPSFAWTPATSALPAGTGQGGLMIPSTPQWVWANGTVATNTTANPTTNYVFQARRSIIKPGSCNSCHGDLGAFTPNPNAANGYANNFHTEYNNDPASCVVCHNTNGVTDGWSYNIKTWVHALHSGQYNVAGTITPFRANAYTAHDTSAFWNIQYPGLLNNCEACHVPGSYDFSNSTNMAQIPNMLWDTVATGSYANTATATFIQLPVNKALPPYNQTTATASYATGPTGIPLPITTGTTTITPNYLAPFVSTSTAYGTTFTANGVPVTPTQNWGGFVGTTWTPAKTGSYNAAGTYSTKDVFDLPSSASAVVSPLTAACAACHDTTAARNHMVLTGGGVWYQQRMNVPLAPVGGNAGVAQTTAANPVLQSNEQCMTCHNPGGVADIRMVHMNFN